MLNRWRGRKSAGPPGISDVTDPQVFEGDHVKQPAWPTHGSARRSRGNSGHIGAMVLASKRDSQPRTLFTSRISSDHPMRLVR